MPSESDSEGGIQIEEEEVRENTGAAEAAVRQAEAEGLTLQLFDNAAGYRRVRKESRYCLAKPFYAKTLRAVTGCSASSRAEPQLAVGPLPSLHSPPAYRGHFKTSICYLTHCFFFYTLRAPLVVVRRGLGEAPRYRRRAPPNRRQTAAAHCKRAGGILKPPPLLGV